MAFNKYLAYRSQGVNPSMYSDSRSEAMKMMDEDMAARWSKDPRAFQAQMIRQAQIERQGKQGEAAPEEKKPEAPAQQQAQPQQAAHNPNAMGDAPIQWPGMNPAAHFGAHQNMIEATNAAWASEMDSRRQQAEAERSRQHEYDMESLRQQENQGQQQAALQYQAQADAARQARNRSLLGAAGIGGYTVRSGPGGVIRTPHPFGNSPFARALLGD